MSVCVVCGVDTSKPLYENYGGSLQLSQCDHCMATIDKYIECENVIIILDLFLHRLEVLRHLLFNTTVRPLHYVVILSVILLCMAYEKLLSHEPASHLEWLQKQPFFYTFLLHSIVEFTVCVAVFSILVVVWNGFHQISFSFGLSWKCLLLSNCAMLLVIPAMVWYDTWKGIYLQLPWLLVLTSQIQIFRAALRTNMFWSMVCTGLSHGVIRSVILMVASEYT
jgi:hypothetical protein